MPLAKKYGIIADIHANYAALSVALNYMRMAEVDKILCLGDFVGFGEEPFKCIEAFKNKANMFSIAGNHDRTVLGIKKYPNLTESAANVFKWTAENLSASDKNFLERLPQAMTIDETFIMAHGSLVDRDAYILNPQEISKNLTCMINDFPTMKVCFFGHTHIPMLINTKSVQTELRETKTFQLDPRDVYLINPGSVGQPRDKCPLASFGIFDAENWRMTFYRKPYDYNQVLRAKNPDNPDADEPMRSKMPPDFGHLGKSEFERN